MNTLLNTLLDNIITFSTIGFAVLLGFPVIMALAWEYFLRRPRVELLTNFYLRLLSLFTYSEVIAIFLALSLMAVLSGLLCSIYFICPIEFLVYLALGLEIVTLGVATVFIVIALFYSFFVPINQVRKIMEYSEGYGP
jgi:hypothetical protein